MLKVAVSVTFLDASIISGDYMDLVLRLHQTLCLNRPGKAKGLINLDDEIKDLETSIIVKKFHGDFVENISPSQRRLRFNKVTADGITKRYDIQLEWLPEAQGFRIIEILSR